MAEAEVIRIVRRYKEAIADVVSDAKVYLYGSYSKGTARPDSDIDVAVVVQEAPSDRFALSSRLWRATRKVNTLIEPILIESSDQSPLYEDIMRTGIAI